MPLFDYLCVDCGTVTEVLISEDRTPDACSNCGSANLKRLLSAPSSLTGASRQSMPGPGDTACCGSSPTHAGCAGPGSCCGKGPA